MVVKKIEAAEGPRDGGESIAYIRQMLGELQLVARHEGADMLCYLIEMAYIEAGDIQAGNRRLSNGGDKRNKSTGMPL